MTVNATGPSVSAIRAYGTKMASAAENIANAQSRGYKKSRVVFENEGAAGTVKARVTRDESPGNVSAEGQELSNVDLAEELVSTIPSTYGLKASVKTLQTEDEMSGTLIDIAG